MIRRLSAVALLACIAIPGFVLNGRAQSGNSANYRIPSQAAREEAKAAIKANPNDYVAYTKLGNWYLQAGKAKAAIKEYKKALKINDTYATAWNNLGSAYHARRKYKDAAKQYRKATSLKPDMAVAYRNLGTALLMLSQYDECIIAFQQALKLDPTILDILPDVTIAMPGSNTMRQYFYFAKICAEAGRIDSALEFLRKARIAGFRDFQKVRQDPAFKIVVADARFKRIAYSDTK